MSSYMYVAYIVLGISACSANSTLMWIILRNRNFLTISNVIVVSLSASDFMLAAIVSPMEMFHYLLPDFQVEGYGCVAHQVLMIFVPLVSIFHLLLVAVERFIKIVYPLHYQGIATRSRTACFIMFAWGFPFSLCIVPFMTFNNNRDSNTTDTGCSTLDLLPCPYLYSVLSIIAVICIVMAVLYSKIITIACRHAREIRLLAIPKPRNAKLVRSSELRALTVLLMTMVYFVFSWTPFSIAIVEECIVGVTPNYYTTAVFIAYFNSTVNPLIYGIGNRELRKSLVDTCCRRKNARVAPLMTEMTTMSVAATKVL